MSNPNHTSDDRHRTRIRTVVREFGNRWRALDSGWQAICLGFVIFLVTTIGIRFG